MPVSWGCEAILNLAALAIVPHFLYRTEPPHTVRLPRCCTWRGPAVRRARLCSTLIDNCTFESNVGTAVYTSNALLQVRRR